MDFAVVGLNHRTAPVEVRERLTVTSAQLNSLLAELRERYAVSGGVWLQTCNRTEVYVTVPGADGVPERLAGFLAERAGFRIEEFRPYVYLYTSRAVVDHLFRVAAGLDSMVLGETEILGQVRQAYEEARERGFTDRLLNALFQQAVAVGKKVRAQTRIDQNPVSVSYAAVQMAKTVVGCLEGLTVLVIGAGEMGSLAARYLVEAGVKAVLVSNRSYERALTLAAELGGQAVRFDQLPLYLAQADIVISCTNAPHLVVSTGSVTTAVSLRGGRPLVFIDIAVPRDVDPRVAELPGVSLYDIDDLQQVVEDNIARRRELAAQAEQILGEEVQTFWEWVRALPIVPVIVALKEKAEGIKQTELRRALNRLGRVDSRQERIVTRLADSIVNQLLHDPIVNLKRLMAEGDGFGYATALQQLFGLAPLPAEGAGPEAPPKVTKPEG
ncbi:MAG: glutamyl-tRNA reductase [Moorellales bacterium]